MTEHEQHILDEYREQKPQFELLAQHAEQLLNTAVQKSKAQVYGIIHRIKEQNSLAGKLHRKGDKYTSLSDITDILGFRIICYFADDVDAIAQAVAESFDIDWENSIDKRHALDINSFGYMAVHYICSIKKDAPLPEELKNKRFEVQMCSLLQHAWAVMNHDLGYKTKFGIPQAVSRDFSRLAGLMEIADEHFSRIRDTVSSYTEDVHQKIVNDTSSEIPIDAVSLAEYMKYSHKMRSFLNKIAEDCHAEIFDDTPENYIEQLAWLHKTKLGDIQKMLEENGSLAERIAQKTLSEYELDIFAASVGLRALCHAELITKCFSEQQASEFFMLSLNNKERSLQHAKELLNEYKA